MRATAFLQRNIGDVLITFESEVVSIDREFGAGKVDAVYPSISILAENPVAGGRAHRRQEGHRRRWPRPTSTTCIRKKAQEIAAKHALRPRSPAVLKKYAATFKPLQLFTVQELFGSLGEAQKVHFNDGGQFDKLYTPGTANALVCP